MTEAILPRLIRIRDAPDYLGLDRNRFNIEVRPYWVGIPIGEQGVGFDCLDLHAWIEDCKSRNGRPGKRQGENEPWDARRSLAFTKGTRSGISTGLSEEEEFAKALERATSKKRKGT